jgi:membrane protein
LLLPYVVKTYFRLFKQTFAEFNADKVPRLGAALAYYTIFSIAPLLLIAIAMAGLVFGREAAQGEIFAQLRGVLGANSAQMVQSMVASAAKPKSGTIATILGIVTLIFGASGVFGQLEDALNTIWDVAPKKNAGILRMLKARFLSAAMVFGIGFLLLVSLIIDAAISAAGKYGGQRLPGGEVIWQTLEQLVSLAVVTVLFAAIFRFLPDLRIAWRDVWLGAALTSVLFVIGKFVLGVYFGKSAVGSSYGAAGSLVLVLLWIYYSAQILLFGAEFTQVYARAYGSVASGEQKPASGAQKSASDVQRATSGGQTVTLRPVSMDGAPAVTSRLAPPAVERPKAGGGAIKLAACGVAGLVLGTLVGGIGALVLAVKSVKKLVT